MRPVIGMWCGAALAVTGFGQAARIGWEPTDILMWAWLLAGMVGMFGFAHAWGQLCGRTGG